MESTTETCLICLRNNYTEKSLMLFNLSTLAEWENITFLNKLEYVLNAEILVFDTTLICSSCVDDLNRAYEFKEKVTKALEYWSGKIEEGVHTEEKDTPVESVPEPPEEKYDDNIEDIQDIEQKLVEVAKTASSLINDGSTDESIVSCNKCDSVFLSTLELNHHHCSPSEDGETISKKPLQTVDKKYGCTLCKRVFKQVFHLREHMTSHTGERNFSCTTCGKTFQRVSSLKRHSQTHATIPGQKSKKTPVLCNICGKRLPYSNSFQRHMRTHTGERRYECKVCNKRFAQAQHLSVHLRTHTGERPYICNVCGNTFSLKATLDKHLKTHSDTRNDIKISHNLEPNLSQTDVKEDSDIKDDYSDDDESFYDNQNYLMSCNSVN